MTLIEGFVYVVGIITTGVTIRYTAGAFASANGFINEIRRDLRTVIENQDEARHDRQMQWEEQHGSENHLPDGPKDDRR